MCTSFPFRDQDRIYFKEKRTLGITTHLEAVLLIFSMVVLQKGIWYILSFSFYIFEAMTSLLEKTAKG